MKDECIGKYCWTSQEALNFGSGTSFHFIDGKSTEVCCITDDVSGTSYKWKDKKCLGISQGFDRPGRTSTWERAVPHRAPHHEN